jgi:hypothetical protein
MYWRKNAIGVRVAMPGEMERIAYKARRDLESLDLEAIYGPLLAEALPAGSYQVELVRLESLFGTDWRPAYQDLEGKLLRARLSVAVGTDWLAGGDLMAEAIFSGFHPPNQPCDVLAARVVTEVVERLSTLIIETAEEDGKRAAVVGLDHSGP